MIAFFAFATVFKEKTNLASPPSAPLASPVAPKTFQFDKNTDLKLELEKINPQVLDSDFD